ncbi:short-chain dehydrogenase [Novosphingobium barchaimii LL02]|uniref:Short-chain dehydrogenase n=1 Tax=Novosphingobium barchaimii LL02 TaxID=1114963 RepID=A0A0J7XK38_9SPHN|nr:SDR family oxidoreductase [Novosphingobium barchaimii]KMS52004.1 short-chain dehydrogenase [Novosphingobium barchaimii LL02]
MTTNTGRLAGKVAIITGASTGCGPVMAKLFVEQGAKVLLAARREELVLEAAKAAGDGAIGMRVDVTSEDDVRAMVDRAMVEFGQVDIMLNNAAAPGQDKWVWEQTVENFNNTLAIDLTAAMLCSREVLNRSMLERGTGSIINFSSTAGWIGMVRKTHYTSAKAALRALTKTIALEVGPKGIRCNCLVPGSIETELWMNWGKRMAAEKGLSYDDWKTQILTDSPLRSIAQPIDIAYLALFLAGEESRMITGQSINCDAGGYMVG